jgi:D-arabinose 1-dehydrogenase-like Zn-dependent alcohol dehydrogenase
MRATVKAMVIHGLGQIALDEASVLEAGINQAVIKVSFTSICGTDGHISRQEWPVGQGRIRRRAALGTIHEVGPRVKRFSVWQSVLIPAITPCGSCFFCL